MQSSLSRHGIIVAGWKFPNGYVGFENGLFGFTRDRRLYFSRLQVMTAKHIRETQQNGYGPFIEFLNFDLSVGTIIKPEEIVFEPEFLK